MYPQYRTAMENELEYRHIEFQKNFGVPNDLKMTNAGDYMTYAENTTVYFNPENITYPVSAHSVSAHSVLHTPKTRWRMDNRRNTANCCNATSHRRADLKTLKKCLVGNGWIMKTNKGFYFNRDDDCICYYWNYGSSCIAKLSRKQKQSATKAKNRASNRKEERFRRNSKGYLTCTRMADITYTLTVS